jgi:hypothetical protein
VPPDVSRVCASPISSLGPPPHPANEIAAITINMMNLFFTNPLPDKQFIDYRISVQRL